MQRFDALVVGGGPAGSSAAWALTRAGRSVLVIDRAAFPRDKVCAGWITPPVVDALKLDLDEYSRGRTLQPITAFRTGIIKGETIETIYDRPVSYGIRRCEFDDYLLKRSRSTLALGEAVTDVVRANGEWIVNGRYRSPILVGAGGHFCPIARRMGPVDGHVPVVAAQEAEFPLDDAAAARCPVRPEAPELYFSADLSGYGWCFRKGRFLNVGLGRVDRGGLREHVRSFVDWLASRGALNAAAAGRLKGHAYLLYGAASRPLIDDGVLLVGDAAGLAYPESGEGIRTAIESGLLAARTIVQAGGLSDREHLEPYRAAIEQRFGAPVRKSTPRSPIVQSLVATVGARLLNTRWFVRQIVLDRWFLHRAVPALDPGP